MKRFGLFQQLGEGMQHLYEKGCLLKTAIWAAVVASSCCFGWCARDIEQTRRDLDRMVQDAAEAEREAKANEQPSQGQGGGTRGR